MVEGEEQEEEDMVIEGTEEEEEDELVDTSSEDESLLCYHVLCSHAHACKKEASTHCIGTKFINLIGLHIV
jgi:hypothetical protein